MLVSKRTQYIFFSVVFTLLVMNFTSGCTDSGPHWEIPEKFLQKPVATTSGAGPSYEEVKPIFKSRCSNCHSEWLDKAYTEQSENRAEILRRVSLRDKPQGMPNGGSPEASAITEKERELIISWASASASTAVQPIAELPPVEKAIQSCSKCHGPGGQSKFSSYPSIAGLGAPYILQQLQSFADNTRTDFIKNWNMNQVASDLFETLSEDQIDEVVQHFSSLSLTPVEGPTMTPVEVELLALGKEKAQTCVACHLNPESNDSPMEAYPYLAGQDKDYLSEQLIRFRSKERNSPLMSGMASTLSDEDIEALALYFSSLPPPKK